MMKLSTMKTVMNTVDDDGKSPLAAEILERWGYDRGTVFCVRASANFVFIFEREGESYFLRFNESSEREIETIAAELEIVQYLNNKVTTAQPVLSKNEQYIEVIETKWGIFYAVVFEALTGKHFSIEELTIKQISAWGQTIGSLHSILKEMPSYLQKGRLSWKDKLKVIRDIIPKSDIAAHKELKRIINWAEGLSITKDNFGIIHYDFELDNLLFNQSQIGMVDFDDCISHWYIADIIYALRDLGEFDITSPIAHEFIKGYKSQCDVDINMFEEVSNFERMHQLITYANLIRSVDIEESEIQQDWLLNLENKLCKYIEQYRHLFEREN